MSHWPINLIRDGPIQFFVALRLEPFSWPSGNELSNQTKQLSLARRRRGETKLAAIDFRVKLKDRQAQHTHPRNSLIRGVRFRNDKSEKCFWFVSLCSVASRPAIFNCFQSLNRAVSWVFAFSLRTRNFPSHVCSCAVCWKFIFSVVANLVSHLRARAENEINESFRNRFSILR